ncbi:WD40 repeat domain-containing protein [Streptomyces sp. CdTB01]|uniref:WD40 repeat domain-containing protein n=1 Tax=Streptomyces sp. CdTB01 TaxID=1725411 RepID=UPI00073AB65F|nr:WD40 repeat domain-containing protein [Streptomyces sp. CdTB01]ALV32232.1 hypothetical protein AS200_09390 [Streptomyces sp. CdTB01]
MTASVAQLVAALRAQATELNSPALAGEACAVAQQLRYHSRVDAGLAALGPATADRLTELAVTRRTPALRTRWTTSRPRRRVVHGHAQITALALAPDGSFVVYATADLVVSRKSLVAAEEPPEMLGAAEHWVSSVVMEAQGRSFVTGDRSGAVNRWTLAGHGVRRDLLGRHSRHVHALAVDPQTGTVFSSADDGAVACADAAGFREIIRLNRTCGSLAFDTRTGTLYTGDAHGEILRWDSTGAGGSLVGSLTGPVTALAVAPGSVLLSTARDGAIHAWERDGDGDRWPRALGRARKPLDGGIAVDGDRVVAADADGRVLTWDLDAVEAPPTVLGTNDWSVRSVCAAAGVVVTGARDGFILRWDTPGSAARPTDPTAVEICGLAVQTDGSAIVTGGAEGVHRWALTGHDRAPRPRLLWRTPVAGLCLPGSTEIVAWNDEGDILVGDLTEPFGELRTLVDHRHARNVKGAGEAKSDSVRHLVVVPHTRSVVAAMDDSRILHLHLDGQHEPRFVGFHRAAVLAAAPDGTWVASAGDDRELSRWSLTRPGERVFLGKTTARARALAVTADSERVITGDDHGVVLTHEASGISPYPARIGRHRQSDDTGRLYTKVRAVAVPDNGAWIASVADDGTIHCCDPKDGSATSLLPANLPRIAVPLGESLLVAGRHGALTLLDVLGGEPPAGGEENSREAVAGQVRSPATANGTVSGIERPPPPRAAPNILTLVLDQFWCNTVRAGRFMDLPVMRADLTAGRAAEAVALCPDIGSLIRFRGFLRATGWTVVDVPTDKAAQQTALTHLACEAATHNDVIVVSGEPTVVAALAADANHARITIVDDVSPWLRSPGRDAGEDA